MKRFKVGKLGRWPAFALIVFAVFWIGRVTSPIDEGSDAAGATSRPTARPSVMSGAGHDHSAMTEGETSGGEMTKEVWTCVMHPQIRLPSPGKCPICAMELVRADAGGTQTGNDRILVMSEAERRLAEIVTVPVVRKFVENEVRMVGKITENETKVKTISAWAPGRIERLYVDYTGVHVKEGDHLVRLYSPELLTAQEELLEAGRRVAGGSRDRSEFLRGSDERALASAREKLEQWGLTPEQIANIEERGTAESIVEINSPIGGVVIEMNVQEGQYVKRGSSLYTVADLHYLWIQLDAYESDLQWIHYGQHVDIETEAYPGETFHGLLSFISPVLDARTRTVKIRVNVENPDLRLKPGMFVRAIVRSKVARGGRVMDPTLAGRYISPMHPEIITDEPGDCPICGMEMIRAEDLGYVSADDDAAKPLVVPVSALLLTGKRAIAYVEVPDAPSPTYEGREVVVGPRAGDYYIVNEGLREGERVVVNGNFVIDSSLQIRGRPSMMNPPDDSGRGAPPELGATPAEFRAALGPLFEAYFNVQVALAGDQAGPARDAFSELSAALDSIDAHTLGADAMSHWQRIAEALGVIAAEVDASDSLDRLRESFGSASALVLEIERAYGHAGSEEMAEIFCPMAFGGEGASWLQAAGETLNPFMGLEMPACGTVKRLYAPRKD